MKNIEEKKVHTPYGKPSSNLIIGKIKGVDMVFLSRHNTDHSIYPSGVNNRANVYALKKENVTHILVSTACGSLKEEIRPLDFVILDQFIDRTSKRESTFFDNTKVCPIPMADPFCPYLRDLLIKSAKELKLRHHEKGTVVTIEGPRFSIGQKA